MTTAALTPQERQALNAWIAEHVLGWTNVHYATKPNLAMLMPSAYWYGIPPGWATEQTVPDYAGDWMYAGPLFDRYDRLWYVRYSDNHHAVFTSFQHVQNDAPLADGTTGPEAIAKACKVWEESKR